MKRIDYEKKGSQFTQREASCRLNFFTENQGRLKVKGKVIPVL
jgi:hypothetical protein